MGANTEEVFAKVFYDDGCVRDIYVAGTTLFDDWDMLWNFIKDHNNINFYIDGEKAKLLPSKVNDVFHMKNQKSIYVSIDYKNVDFVCHFFCIDELELDISPKQINNMEKVKAVLEFMENLSKLLNKKVSISLENDRAKPLLTFSPNSDYITYY